MHQPNLFACICDATEEVPVGTEGSQNLEFFGVRTDKTKVTAEEVRGLIQNHIGEFEDCNPFDGEEHSYIELGAFVGDQGAALRLMGMGADLGLWTLLTPTSLMPFLPEELRMQMAGNGFVCIKVGA
jgi:hypothetical protein